MSTTGHSPHCGPEVCVSWCFSAIASIPVISHGQLVGFKDGDSGLFVPVGASTGTGGLPPPPSARSDDVVQEPAPAPPSVRTLLADRLFLVQPGPEIDWDALGVLGVSMLYYCASYGQSPALMPRRHWFALTLQNVGDRHDPLANSACSHPSAARIAYFARDIAEYLQRGPAPKIAIWSPHGCLVDTRLWEEVAAHMSAPPPPPWWARLAAKVLRARAR